jgi:hypothetical protein
LPLDVRKMHRAGVLRQGYTGGWHWTNNYTGESVANIGFTIAPSGVLLRYSVNGDSRSQYVRLAHTGCHFGGVRPWFICPIQGERVAVLYMRGGRFACRRCNRIAYMSQSEGFIGRVWRKQDKVERRLGEDWERPKGMHRATHERLLGILEKCETVRDYALVQALERMGLTF